MRGLLRAFLFMEYRPFYYVVNGIYASLCFVLAYEGVFFSI